MVAVKEFVFAQAAIEGGSLQRYVVAVVLLLLLLLLLLFTFDDGKV